MKRLPGRDHIQSSKKIAQASDGQCSDELAIDFSKVESYYDYDTAWYPSTAKVFINLLRAFLLFLSKLWTRWTVEGIENLEKIDRNRGVIYVANHTSFIDPILLVCAEMRSRRIRFLYKKEFDDNPVFTYVFARLGALPLVRGSADRKALKRAVKALERGEDVGIFPEGTRIKSRFGRGEVHGGFALIAHSAQAPIVPVAIEGAWALPKPRKIRIKIGSPIFLEEFNHLDRKARIAALETRAMSEVFAMREELDARNNDYSEAIRKLQSLQEG